MIEISDEAKAEELISIFMCKKDIDIESFIKTKAILFEKLGKSRTYFIYDEDREDFQILAYYTIAIQVLKIPDGMLSGNMIKRLDGLSANVRGNRISEFPTILIGQIGKNDKFSQSITGSEVIEYCLATIFEGQEKLGGRIIMLECKDVPYLIRLYKKFGFDLLEKDYENGELLQMIRLLDEDEIIEITSY